MLCVVGAYLGLWGYVAYTDPVKSNPVAPRSTVIPFDGLKYVLGLGEKSDDHDEEWTAHDVEAYAIAESKAPMYYGGEFK